MTSAADPPPTAAQGRGRQGQPRIVNRRPATKQHLGHKPRKRRAWRPLRVIVAQRAPVRVFRPAPVVIVSYDTASHRPIRLHQGRPLQFYAVLDSNHAQEQAERERRALRQLASAWSAIAREAQHRDEHNARAMHRHGSHDSDEEARLIWLDIQAEEASPIRDQQRRAALFRKLASARRRQHG